ncbi:iron-sulfur cluster repair di-iron protein [Salisaeta longa]|uniref:iron-sulfur cluster repair di-iron protein n=1 Tax=Salisaeta longa TaxID=503170 RepID=UPI0003B6D9F9|nr:iron-sulfur cluster repair di-iron protein [Salisaeta longa]
MTSLLQTSLGDLVAQNDRRAVLFDRLDLDYCCGGDQTLEAACQARGLAPSTVAAALEALDAAPPAPDATAPATDWTSRPLPALIDHIVDTHHAYLRRTLPELDALFARVSKVHSHDHPWLTDAADVFGRLRLELNAHMQKEETAIFPMIRSLAAGDARPTEDEAEALIASAEDEHDEAGAALRTLRTLSDDFTPPPDACGSFRRLLSGLDTLASDMHRHVHKENSILFPRARRRLETQRAQTS